MSLCRPTESRRGRGRRWAYAVIPAVAFAAGIGIAFTASKTRDEPFRGVYRQEAISVVADRSGTLVAVEAPHGTAVTPGQTIAVIEDASNVGDELRARRDSLERELGTATRKAAAELAVRIAAVEKDRLETRLRSADLLRSRLDVQVKRRAIEAGDDGGTGPVAAGPRARVRQASVVSPSVERRLTLSDLRNHEEVLDAQIALCEDRLTDLDRVVAELPTRTEQAFEVDRIRTDLAELDRRIDEAEGAETTIPVRSPAHGRVGVYRRRAKEPVSAGETIVEVFDAERPYVLVSVGLKEAARLNVGQRVVVAFEGVESKKPLSGVVADVRSDAEVEADSAVAPGAVAARIRIMPAGRLWPVIPPGTTALVRVED